MSCNFSNSKYGADPQRRGDPSIPAPGDLVGSDGMDRMRPSHSYLERGIGTTDLLGWSRPAWVSKRKLIWYLPKIRESQMAGGTRREFCGRLDTIIYEKRWGDPANQGSARLVDWQQMQGGFDGSSPGVKKPSPAVTAQVYESLLGRVRLEVRPVPHGRLELGTFADFNRMRGLFRGEASGLCEPPRIVSSEEMRGVGLTDRGRQRATSALEARDKEREHRPPLPSRRFGAEARRWQRASCSLLASREARAESIRELQGCGLRPEPSGMPSGAACRFNGSVVGAEHQDDAVSVSRALTEIIQRSLEPINRLTRDVYSYEQSRGLYSISTIPWDTHRGGIQRTATTVPGLEAVSL